MHYETLKKEQDTLVHLTYVCVYKEQFCNSKVRNQQEILYIS